MASRTFRNAEFGKHNKGSGVVRFQETNPATGVALTSSDITMFAGVGGAVDGEWIEIPYVSIQGDEDNSDLQFFSDETKQPLGYYSGDREVTINITVKGNYVKTTVGSTINVTSCTKTSGVCVLTVASHTILVGQGIRVVLTTNGSEYNGDHIVTAVTATTITYTYGTTNSTTATGTVAPATFDTLRRFVKSFENGKRTFKMVRYNAVKEVGSSLTAVGYEKIIYWNCRTVPNWKDDTGNDSRDIVITIKATILSTAPNQSPGGQIYLPIPVNSIQAIGSETAELQSMATT